ncbi:MAG: YceI family protein [Bacteroidota bacterium]|nr:YceI family protein [Bacteroidota bacterium]
MKKLMYLSAVILMIITLNVQAQTKYFTKEGRTQFYSKAPLEEIEAVNKKVTSVLDASNGQIEFSVLMKAFEFQKALMQEHFNENYVESGKFPKATFKGVIDNADDVKWTSDGVYPVKVTGKMTLHGVTKDITVPGTIEIKGGKIFAKSTFNLLIKDYDIEIPNLVKDKVAETVKVEVDLKYELFTANK